MYLKKIREVMLAGALVITSPMMTTSILTIFSTPVTLAQTKSDARMTEADRLVIQSRQQWRRGQLLLAADSLEQALAIYEQINDLDSIKNKLYDLEYIYGTLDKHDKIDILKTRFKAFYTNNNDNNISQKEKLYNEALTRLITFKDYYKSIQIFEILLRSLQDKKDKMGELKVLNELGNAYIMRQNLKQAIYYFEQFLSASNQLKPFSTEEKRDYQDLLLSVLNSLGELYYQQKKYSKALSYFKETNSLSQKPLIVTDGDKNNILSAEGFSLINIAKVYIDLKEYSVAITYLKDALRIVDSNRELIVQGDRNFRQMQVDAFSFLGIAYFHMRQFEESEQALVKGIEFSELLWGYNYHPISENFQTLEQPYGTYYSFKMEYFETQAYLSQLLQQVLVLRKNNNLALEFSEQGRTRLFLENFYLKRSIIENPNMDNLLVLEERMQILSQEKERLDKIAQDISTNILQMRSAQSEKIWQMQGILNAMDIRDPSRMALK